MAFTQLHKYPGQTVNNMTLINKNQFLLIESDYVFIYERIDAAEGEWRWIKNDILSSTPETVCLSECKAYIYTTKANKLFQVNIKTLESRTIQLPFRTSGSQMIELYNTLHIIGGIQNVHSKINIDYDGNNNDWICPNYHSDFEVSRKRRGGQLFYNKHTNSIYYVGGRETFRRNTFCRDVIAYDTDREQWEFYPSEIQIPAMNNYQMNGLMVNGNILLFGADNSNNIWKYGNNGWQIAQNILPEKGEWQSVFMKSKCNAIRLVQGYQRRTVDFNIPLVLTYLCKNWLSGSNGEYVMCSEILLINCNTKNMYSIDSTALDKYFSSM
eukprot:231359_1